MRKIVITGGGGFIGSHIVDRFVADFPNADILVLDKMTYAADFQNIAAVIAADKAQLIVGDICNYALCLSVMKDAELVVHAAAESHVDRSFHSSIPFTVSNAVGTHTVMEACRTLGVPRIIHVSTDEVYGEVPTGAVDETGAINPTNPYSASKAAAEMIVNGYRHSFKLPVITVRANNIFGVRQFPEKLIPRSIMRLIQGEKIQLHGDGSNVRHFLSALDFAEAIELLARRGTIHEVYNIGSPDEYSNRTVVEFICRILGADFEKSVEFIRDRPFNDRRYAISWDKITALGWAPRRRLMDEMEGIVGWYRSHATHLSRRMMWAEG